MESGEGKEHSEGTVKEEVVTEAHKMVVGHVGDDSCLVYMY